VDGLLLLVLGDEHLVHGLHEIIYSPSVCLSIKRILQLDNLNFMSTILHYSYHSFLFTQYLLSAPK